VAPTISGLHVEGNHFVDQGKTVRLLGVNHSGTESNCRSWNGEATIFQGPTDATLVAGMKTWHINAVRIPLNEDCWLGLNGVPAAVGGTNYQQGIAKYVQMIRTGGLYVIVDLHMNSVGDVTAGGVNISDQQAMADKAHSLDFWKSVASTFKGDQGVVFDLYNEPAINDSSRTTTPCDDTTSQGAACWQCWLSGCSLTTKVSDPRNGGGASIKTVTWATAGMQDMVSAVRSSGAKNVVMAGGWNYASVLDQWTKYKPNDPLNNMSASFHTYSGINGCADSDATCLDNWWNAQLGAIAQGGFPVVTGEFGEYGGCNSESNFMSSWFAFADPKGFSYTAWTWDTWGGCAIGPNLISDYGGTPNGSAAQAYRDHLLTLVP
jgi:endoglucanase